MAKDKIPEGWVKVSEFEGLTGIAVRTIQLAIKRGKISKEAVTKIGSGATSPVYLDPVTSARSWYDNLNGNHHLSRPLRETLQNYLSGVDPDNAPDRLPFPESGITFEEATRLEKIAKARIAELDLAEKEGSLVSRARITEQLFNAGQELRDALLTIPDRIIDEVIANTDNRSKAHSILYGAIENELQKIVDINGRI